MGYFHEILVESNDNGGPPQTTPKSVNNTPITILWFMKRETTIVFMGVYKPTNRTGVSHMV